MSYHIYTTDGIILKRTTFGEANILLHILTHDLGLIIASARSARLSVSKLRPALQEYAHVSVSCIKGKGGWKITNVVEKGNFYFENPEYTHTVVSQISSVLMKMIPGESPHKEIFKSVSTGFHFLKEIPKKFVSDLEVLLVLRILNQLGYVVKDNATEIFLNEDESWSLELLEKINDKKKEVIKVINRALKESQL